MSLLTVPRMIATGSVVTAATSARVGGRWAALVVQRAPALVRLGVRGTADERASAEFRDELLALARESAEVSWREMRRAVDELDTLTRTDAPATNGRRPYRVKR